MIVEPDAIQITCSPAASAMIKKLVDHHGFASKEAAVEEALERLLEEVDADGQDEDLFQILREADEELERGSQGIPLDQAFEEMYRDFGIKRPG